MDERTAPAFLAESSLYFHFFNFVSKVRSQTYQHLMELVLKFAVRIQFFNNFLLNCFIDLESKFENISFDKGVSNIFVTQLYFVWKSRGGASRRRPSKRPWRPTTGRTPTAGRGRRRRAGGTSGADRAIPRRPQRTCARSRRRSAGRRIIAEA